MPQMSKRRFCCARLDFHKNDVLFVLGYHVNLYVPQTPVTLHNLVAILLQILACSIFAKVTYLVVECHIYVCVLRIICFVCGQNVFLSRLQRVLLV